MIQANELRIGNYVSHNENWNYAEHKGEFIWSDRDWLGIGESCLSLNDVSPIPLSPEWLIRLGFEMDDSLNQGTNNDWFLGNESDYTSWYLIKRDTFAIIKREISTVHELQNLIFALTGEELTLKQ